MSIIGIYKITNPKGKVYIGQSIDCYKRKKYYQHSYCKKQIFIYRSILKYGWDSHKWEIVCQCEEKELNNLEKYYSGVVGRYINDQVYSRIAPFELWEQE